MPNLHQIAFLNVQDSEKRRILKSLKQIIQNELTDVQRDTFIRYHLKQQSITKIAEETGVNKSTVSRNLCRAEQKIAKFSRYLN